MRFNRKTLERLSATQDWAWSGRHFLKAQKLEMRFGIVGLGVLMMVFAVFGNPLPFEIFFGSILAAWLSAIFVEKAVRVAARKKIKKDIDSIAAENVVDELLASPPPLPVEILLPKFPKLFLPRSSAKKNKLINHLGAALRALTFAPSFPRTLAVFPPKS